jgi:hypothetical protein
MQAVVAGDIEEPLKDGSTLEFLRIVGVMIKHTIEVRLALEPKRVKLPNAMSDFV